MILNERHNALLNQPTEFNVFGRNHNELSILYGMESHHHCAQRICQWLNCCIE